MQRWLLRLSLWLSAATLVACQSAPQSSATLSPPAPSQQAQTMIEFELPLPTPARLFQHPLPEIYRLSNGLEVWYLHNPMLPIVSMKVVFDGGSVTDSPEKAGRAALMAMMLKEGASGKSAQAISDAIEDLGAALYTSTSQDSIIIDLQSLTHYFPETLDIMADIWLRPDFPEDAFARLRRIWESSLVRRASSPDHLAKLAGNRAFFGDDHPYAVSTEGYLDTLANISLDDIREQYARLLAPSRATFIATGNLAPSEFIALLEARFGQLPLTHTQNDIPAIPARDHQLSVTIVDKPNAPQTIIRISLPSTRASDPKTLFFRLVNVPFGGTFTSRLMQNIREDKGYSYGAYSVVAALRYDGFLLAESAVSSDVTGAALKEFIDEISRLGEGDFTEEEFERAKATWQSETVQSFETQSGVLSILLGLAFNRQSPDTVNAFVRRLPEMTLEDFNALAREFPKMSQASITLVGDKATILEQIRELNLPAPTYRDTQGFLIASEP